MIDSPVKILTGIEKKTGKEKFFSLNINSYRNVHHFQLNNTKKIYSDIMIPRLMNVGAHYERFNRVKIQYTIIASNKRKFDAMNVVAIVDKYFQDVLVKLGIITDDNYSIVEQIEVLPVEIDKMLPENICRIKVIQL